MSGLSDEEPTSERPNWRQRFKYNAERCPNPAFHDSGVVLTRAQTPKQRIEQREWEREHGRWTRPS